MKGSKRIFTAILAFILLFCTLKIEPVFVVQAASKSSAEKEIEKLENDIKKWEKELAEYEKKGDEATKGALGIMAGAIANYDPLIIKGGIMHPEVPYLHITNYTPDFMEGMIGAINGFFRKTGTYTYEFNGTIVPDYEKVYDYGDKCSALQSKISKAQKKLDALKADLYAELTLLSEKKVTLGKGQSFTIYYELSKGVSDSTIAWTSSDKAVATVSKTGVIKAKEIGTAKITGKAKINGTTISMSVTVKEKAESISLKTKSLELASGETKQLKTTLSPAKSYAKIFWECSDDSVAKVDEKGVVTAVAPGSAYIYAYSDTKKTSNACKVTVKGENVSYKKASSKEAALSIVKASGYLESGTDYFFEVITDDNQYFVMAYPDIDEYMKIISGASKKKKWNIEWEGYYLESSGKKVSCLVKSDEFYEFEYFYDPEDLDDPYYYNRFFIPEDYVMLKGLKFEAASISVLQNTYQKLVLEAKNVGQLDYLRITSENPDVAEVVFSEETGEVYIQGKSQGKTTITAETIDGQKAVLQVEVHEKGPTKDEVLKAAEERWIKENATQLIVEPGDQSFYDDMNTYSWWLDWYAADDLSKIEMFYDEFGDDYEEKQYAYENPNEWITIITDIYLDGMDQAEVQKKYEHSRDIYENGLWRQVELDDELWWKYDKYIENVEKQYEKENRQDICKNPVTAKTYQKKHRSSKYYKNEESIPFQTYYILLEKESGTLVFAAEEWYEMKEWLMGKKFLK